MVVNPIIWTLEVAGAETETHISPIIKQLRQKNMSPERLSDFPSLAPETRNNENRRPSGTSLLFLLPLPSPLALNFSVVFAPPLCLTMVNKKRKTLPKSPDRPTKASKEPKISAPPVSGTLVAVEGGGLAFSPAPTRKKLSGPLFP